MNNSVFFFFFGTQKSRGNSALDICLPANIFKRKFIVLSKKLTVTGSGIVPKLKSIPEVDPKDKTAIMVRLADNATCAVSVGDKMVGSAILPVFELGRTAYIANTIIKK